MKFKALPFLVGCWGMVPFGGSFEFAVSSTIVMVVLVISGTIKFY